jgi:hypothetical protein
MSKYKIYKRENEIDIFGYDQCFDEDDIKSLWQEHNILYIKSGIVAVWVEKRKGINPLVHLMGEDDGHLFWSKKKDVCFDSHWLDNYIETLIEVKNRIKD